MEQTPRTKERRRRRRLLAFLTMAMLVGSVTSTAFSLAQFTSGATNTAAFGAGTVVIAANGQTDPADPVAITFSGASAMKPGDSVSGKVLVVNAGTLNLHYNVSLATAASVGGKPNLAIALQMTVTRYAGDIDCAAPTGAATVRYGPAAAMSPVTNPIIGFNTLNFGQRETLCMTVTWPNGTALADDPYQGAGTNATFTFFAEQV